jgi:hypothetical protein
MNKNYYLFSAFRKGQLIWLKSDQDIQVFLTLVIFRAPYIIIFSIRKVINTFIWIGKHFYKTKRSV